MTTQHPPAAPLPGARHRLWLGLHLDGAAAFAAGAIAGTVFLILELITAFAFGAETPFGPAQITLQGLTGAEAVPGTFNPGLVLAALVLHYALSIALAIPLALLLHPWKNMAVALAVSGVFGCLLYYLNVLLLAAMLPVWESGGDVFMVIDYALFGMITAYTYLRLRG